MAAFLIFSPLAALKAHVVTHLLLAGLGTYALGRAVGLGCVGALVAGAAYEFGPYADFTTCCGANLQLGAWLPIALLGVEMAVRPVPPRSGSAMLGWWTLAGFAVSQIIAGYVGKGAMYGLVVVGSYVAYRTIVARAGSDRSWRDRARRCLLTGFAVFGIGFGLSAASLLPRIDYLERTNLRGGDYGDVVPEVADTGGWTIPTALDRVVNPGFQRWYVGGVSLGLALTGALVARGRYQVPFWALLAAIAFVLSTRAGPVHALFYLIPRFEVLHEHFPNRVLVVGNLGLAVLAGAGASALTEQGPNRTRWIAWLVPVGAFVALTLVLEREGRTVSRTTTLALVGVTLALLGAVGLALARRRISRVGLRGLYPLPALALLLGILWDPTGSTMVDNLRRDTARWRQREPVIRAYAGEEVAGAAAFLQAQAPTYAFRFAGYDARFLPPHGRRLNYFGFFGNADTAALLVNNRAVLLGLHDIQGYNPVYPRAYVRYVDAMNGRPQEYHEADILASGLASPLLDLLNVRYLVVPREVPPGRPDLFHLALRFQTVYEDTEVRVLENPGAVPRAWLVHEARQVPVGQSLSELTDVGFDPMRTAIMEDAPPALAVPGDAAGESVRIDHYEADVIGLAVTAETDALVMLSETWDPGWRAYVDGESVGLVRANFLFRAVPVPAGEHVVELRYEPRPFTLGLVVTGGTAVLIVAVVIGLMAVERRRPRDRVG